MKKSPILHVFPWASCIAILASPVQAAPESPRPNILILLSDDQGYADLGVQGSKDIPTPHIDSLAHHGVRCTAGYVSSPMCSPSRAGFITGGHNYFTQSYRDAPPLHHYNSLLERNGQPQPAAPGYLTTVLGDEAASFIHRNKEKPWLLFTSFNAPHTPIQAPPGLIERVKHIEDEKRRTYAAMIVAMIVAMDDAIGRILKQLRADGLEDRTLIFFLSDNGGTTEANTSSNAPLRGRKGTMWEGGFRVPFLAQWKGVLPAGKAHDRPVSSLDILPTALAAAGATSIAPQPLDGTDLMPHLIGKTTADPPKALFWRIAEWDIWAVRIGDHKLIRQDGKITLHDLAADPAEARDLSKELPEVRARLQKTFDTWQATLSKPLWKIYRTPEIEAAEEERRKRNNSQN